MILFPVSHNFSDKNYSHPSHPNNSRAVVTHIICGIRGSASGVYSHSQS